MATVKTLYDRDGKPRAYKVRYRVDGQPRSKTYPKGHKADADAFAATIETDKLTGRLLDRRAERLTVATYAREWLDIQTHRRGTAIRAGIALRQLEHGGLGDVLLGRVRPSHMKAWRKWRAAQVAPATLATDWMWVRAFFAAAVADKLIHESPCVAVRAEPVEQRQPSIPGLEELAAIHARLPARWAAVAVVGAQTGLRPGELLGLCVEQVDFLRRMVRVDRQLRYGEVVLEPKTSSSRRDIPVDQITLDVLAAHLAAWPPCEGLVFHAASGRPLHRRWVNQQWRQAAARAGAEGVRMHDLRHLYASGLIASGATVPEVQRRLGHASSRETLDTYAHLWEDHEERTRAAVAAMFSGASWARPAAINSGL